jgi:hypothetical protein
MSLEETVSFNLTELNNITEEQSELIQNVLQQIKPIECEILGKKTIAQISKGKSFDAVEGGRHLSLVETISILSGIATITQLAIIIIQNLKNKSTENAEQTLTDDDTEQIKNETMQSIKEAISKHLELKKLDKITNEDNAILDEIVTELLKDMKS